MITLEPLQIEDREQFILDNQWAFKYGAQQEFGLQDELDEILGHRTQRYWVAYLLGIPTLFIYPLVWMANIAEELKEIAIEMGIEGPHTSWWHMFGWNTFGVLFMGPAIATGRFFSTLNKIEQKLNHED